MKQTGINYQIEFRIYDSGIAFRYMLIQEELTEIDDFTTFYLPDNCSCWIQDNIVSYEGKYKSFLSGELPLQTVAGPPITIKYPSGIYAAITEGGVTNFSGMGLSVISPNGFQSRLDGNTVLAGSIATPWRIIMTGTLTDLVNNDIISDVSAPLSPVFNGKTDWIKTGNCLWSWLTGYDVTFENMKKFVDWAKELHIPYVLVDEGWSHWKDKQKGLDSWQLIKKLCDYARKKGVKIIVWKSFPTRKGIEGIESPDLRYRFLSKCKEAGISGVKLDFFNSENQKITRYYEETLKEAAEIGLVVIFHGSNKPTGLERTYPNEISRESIRGMGIRGRCRSKHHYSVYPSTGRTCRLHAPVSKRKRSKRKELERKHDRSPPNCIDRRFLIAFTLLQRPPRRLYRSPRKRNFSRYSRFLGRNDRTTPQRNRRLCCHGPT